MKPYHESTLLIREPDLLRGRKNTDPGQGFYLAPKYTQAGIKPEKALPQLRWVCSGKITKQDPTLGRAQQEACAATHGAQTPQLLGRSFAFHENLAEHGAMLRTEKKGE